MSFLSMGLAVRGMELLDSFFKLWFSVREYLFFTKAECYQIMHIALSNIHWYMYQLVTPFAITFFQFSEVHTEF